MKRAFPRKKEGMEEGVVSGVQRDSSGIRSVSARFDDVISNLTLRVGAVSIEERTIFSVSREECEGGDWRARGERGGSLDPATRGGNPRLGPDRMNPILHPNEPLFVPFGNIRVFRDSTRQPGRSPLTPKSPLPPGERGFSADRGKNEAGASFQRRYEVETSTPWAGG